MQPYLYLIRFVDRSDDTNQSHARHVRATSETMAREVFYSAPEWEPYKILSVKKLKESGA